MYLREKAFSLIELMIVIAIVGLLSAVAGPSYQNYIQKTKTTAALSILSGLKNQVVEYYELNSSWPDINALGLTTTQFNDDKYGITAFAVVIPCSTPAAHAPHEYCLRMQMANMTESGASGYIGLIASYTNNQFVWGCTNWPTSNSGHIPSRWMPVTCTMAP